MHRLNGGAFFIFSKIQGTLVQKGDVYGKSTNG